jgi:dTDP-4-amino-4,6-dideoxygalactose transaminase
MLSPFCVVKDFERNLCEYTGAKYAVTTTSCTQAILMACAYWRYKDKSYVCKMPRLSYVGVPASICNAGHAVEFRSENWQGEYEIFPLPVWDSARRFTSDMFRPGLMQCVSFHVSKILGDTQGGAILHDNDEADQWLRRARFDGRTEGVDPKNDQVQYPSWHAYMSPDVAARLNWKLSVLPKHNADLPRSDYPDLSTLKAFQND